MTEMQKEFYDWLNEEISRTYEDVEENKGFPNSYGAGFDNGRLETLLEIKNDWVKNEK